VAQGHLRTCLGFLDMPTLGQPEAYIQIKDGFFDDAGNVANPESKKFLSGWMDKYVTWVKRITAAS
jgi:chromate reductase